MENIKLLVLFIEGIVSFFSPCVIPVLPVYINILSNSENTDDKKKNFFSSVLFRNTLFFVLGISITFFILGLSINALGSFFNTNKDLITTIGGLIIIFMGLFYAGILKSTLLNREKRIHLNTNKKMNIFSAFLLGFTFSFGWTPCIGPMLASVMILSSTAGRTSALLLIVVYTLGFVLPFIAISLFYKKLIEPLSQVKKHMNKIKFIGGLLLIFSGIFMVYNSFGGTVKYFNGKFNIENTKIETPATNAETESNQTNSQEENSNNNENVLPAIDFTFLDQYGKKHTLSNYKGKTIFLNFWATWCPPCREEMPYIEELYKEYGENKNDVIILGVASPEVGKEKNVEGIKEFLKNMNMTFPTVMDNNGSQVYQYGIYAFPSTLIINKDGNIVNYIPGAMNKETMKKIIEDAQ